VGAQNNLVTHLFTKSYEIFLLNNWHITGNFFIFLFPQFPLKKRHFSQFFTPKRSLFPKKLRQNYAIFRKIYKNFSAKSRKTKKKKREIQR